MTVDCLTEPGIVRFPVAHRPKRGPVFEEATGKRYEAREGVSTVLARTGTESGRTATVFPIPARTGTEGGRTGTTLPSIPRT